MSISMNPYNAIDLPMIPIILPKPNSNEYPDLFSSPRGKGLEHTVLAKFK